MTSFCCPPNVVRTIAEVGGYAYGRSDGTIWVNLYGSSTLDTTVAEGSRIRLEQKTNYPWDGEIRITVRRMRFCSHSTEAAHSRLGKSPPG